MRAVLPALALICFAVGVWCFLPLIEEEHQRLELPLALGLWAGDLVAVFWCLECIARTLLKPDQAGDQPVGGRHATRGWLLVSASLLLGMAADLGVTAYAIFREREAYATADQVMGEVYAVDVKRFPESTRYRFHCRFRDSKGDPFTFVCTARQENGIVAPELPEGVLAATQGGPLPQPVPVSYDPAWPGRSWISGVGWRFEEYSYCHRFHGFSVLVLLFQAIMIPVFLVMLWDHSRKGTLPWWREYHKIVPLLVGGFTLFLFGFIYRMEVR